MKLLYIPVTDQAWCGQNWRTVAKRIGATVTMSAFVTPYVLSCNDASSVAIAEGGKHNFMSKYALWNITDRIGMTGLGIPVMPTVFPQKPTDLIGKFDGPIFVKSRRTYGKNTDPLAYTTWTDVAEFIATAPQTFWGSEKIATNFGEFVVQPALSFPLTDLDVNFAVNERGEVKFFLGMEMRHLAPNTPDTYKMVAIPEIVKDHIRTVIGYNPIKGGIHNVQFAWYNEQWVLLDWNTRPALGFSQGVAAAHPGLLDSALAFMMDIPGVEDTPFYLEQRSYYDDPFTMADISAIYAIGLVPRVTNGIINRVAGIADNKTMVDAMFVALDALKK